MAVVSQEAMGDDVEVSVGVVAHQAVSERPKEAGRHLAPLEPGLLHEPMVVHFDVELQEQIFAEEVLLELHALALRRCHSSQRLIGMQSPHRM